MKKLLLFFFVTLIVITLTRCSEDDEKPSVPTEKESLIRITFTGYLPDASSEGYLVITDTIGNILCTRKIANNSDSTYYPDTDFKGTKINLYLIHKSGPYYHTSAYLHLKRGANWGMDNEGVRGVRNPIKLELKNIPSFQYITYGTNYYGFTFTNLADTVGRRRLNYIETGKAYGQLVANGMGRYGFFDIDEVDESVAIDFSNLPKVSSKVSVNVPLATAESGHYRLFVQDKNGEFISTYWLFDVSFYGKTVDVFYPEEQFQKYSSQLSYFTPTRYYADVRTSNTLDFSYQPISFDATIVNPSPANFKAEFTGTFDHYYASFSSADNKTFIHVRSSKFVSEFRIPDFSGVVPFEKLNFSDFKLSEFSMNELDGLTETPAYFNYYSTQPLFKPQSQKIVALRF